MKPDEVLPINNPGYRKVRRADPGGPVFPTTAKGDELFDRSRAEYGVPRSVTSEQPGAFKHFMFTGENQ